MNHASFSSFIQKISSVITAVVLVTVSLYPVAVVQAASIVDAANSMSRLAVNQLSDHEIEFTTPTGVASGQTITLTFPSDFDGSNDP